MRITVLLFANLAEAIGHDRLVLEVGDDATVADALEALARDHQAIAAMRGTLAVAVDEHYATMNMKLREGCMLALIPPVSGG